MAVENGKVTFSVRLPPEMVAWVDERRIRNKRSRNAEIEVLMEEIHDLHKARERKLQEATAQT